MVFTMSFLRDLFPKYDGILDETVRIDHVFTDSREQKENGLFVPLTGENFDGHDFLISAIGNGAVATLWQQGRPTPDEIPKDFLVFYVEDPLKGLQFLAKSYRHLVNPTVVGITGSNGKTTTKDLLHGVLQKTHKTHATIGNFNNEIGLPLTILQMPSNTEMLILEMGMNHFQEIEALTKLAAPDHAIITNIGESHIEYLGSRAGIAKAKLEIVLGLKQDGFLFIDADESLLTRQSLPMPVVTCGWESDATAEISDIAIAVDHTAFTLNHATRFTIPLLGKHHAKNATYVIALARQLGMDDQQIQQGLTELAHSSMRFEQVHGKKGVLLINDAYNASVTSMKAAIDVVKELPGFNEKVVVLGDILELGDQVKEMHRQVAESIDKEINYVYTYGQHAEEITNVLKREQPQITVVHFTDRALLEQTLQNHLNNKNVILFKASRMMQFEQFVEACK